MTETESRAAFESWVLSASTAQENLLERLPDGNYKWQIVHAGWAAWQGAWSARTTVQESHQPVESPYKQFFMAMWEEYCDGNLDISELVYDAACKYRLATCEEYDPDIHGEALGSEWGLEKGDPCYVLVKQPKAPMRESVAQAIAKLHSMIDGGEECRGRDSEISDVIRILEQGK